MDENCFKFCSKFSLLKNISFISFNIIYSEYNWISDSYFIFSVNSLSKINNNK